MPDDPQGLPGARTLEEVLLPHLDAAYNLARWLVGKPQDAEDVVQEACLRAVRFVGGYRAENARGWLLRIVRNTAYSFLEKRRPADLAVEFDETLYVPEQTDAEAVLVQSVESKMLQVALEGLPVRFREAIVLREVEGLSYRQIAEVMDIPMGTVMSSLARAREQLRKSVLEASGKEVRRGL